MNTEIQTRTKLDRTLRLFSDVRAGEGLRVVSMMVSLLTLMIAYYLLKTVQIGRAHV